MKLRYMGHMQLLSKAKYSLLAKAQKEVCPRYEIADPPGTAVLPIDRHDFAEGFMSFRATPTGDIFDQPSGGLS